MPSLIFQQQTRVDPALAPADARGVGVTPAIGEAVESLGQQGTRLASDMARIQYQQKEADGVAQLQKNISDGYRNFTQSMDDWKADPNVVAQNGAGLTAKFTGTYADWQQQLVDQQATPRLKRMAAEQSRTMGDHFFNQAHTWEVETNRAWRVQSVDESINTDASTIQQSPGMYDDMLKNKLDAIDALRDLHPADHINLTNKVRSTYAEAASLGHAQQAPQDTVNLLTGQHPLPAGSIPDKITQTAKAKGVDPASALAIAQFESKMDPGAKNGQSLGLYQLQPGTADTYDVKDRFDPDENIKGGVGYLADNQKAFRASMKRAPTLPELYSMHLLGTAGGLALTKADNAMPFAQLAQSLYGKNADAVQARNHLQNMTVGQVKDTLAGWMSKASNDTAGMANAPPAGESGDSTQLPSYLQQLTPQGRQAILTHAQAILRKDDSAARVQVHAQVQDEVAANQRGEAVKNPLSVPQMISMGLSRTEAENYGQQLDTWRTFGANYAQVKTLGPAEQATLVNAAKPTPGEPGYALKAQTYDALVNATQYVRQQRQDNPIKADAGSLQTATPLDPNQPGYLTTQLQKRFLDAEQISRNFGTPYTVLDKDSPNELPMIASKLATDPPQAAMSDLLQMRMAAPTQQHFMALMQQLGQTHMAMANAGQLATSNQPAAMKVIEGDRLLHPPKGEKAITMPGDEKFRAWWDANVGAAYQGVPMSSEADRQAAMAYYAATQPAGQRNDKIVDPDLMKAAAAAVAPMTTYNGVNTLIPAGSDPSRFADTIASRWDGAVQAHGLDPKDYPREAYSLGSAGYDGAYIPYQGTTPLTANGRPVVIDLNAAPQPTAPPQAQRAPLKGRKITVDDIDRDKRFMR